MIATVINASFEHQNRHRIMCKNNFNFALFFLYWSKEKCLTYISIFFSCRLGKKWRCIIWCKTRSIFDLEQSFEHAADHCQNYQIWWCGNTILTPNSSLNYTNLPLPLEGNHLARQIAETICSSIIYVCTQQNLAELHASRQLQTPWSFSELLKKSFKGHVSSRT